MVFDIHYSCLTDSSVSTRVRILLHQRSAGKIGIRFHRNVPFRAKLCDSDVRASGLIENHYCRASSGQRTKQLYIIDALRACTTMTFWCATISTSYIDHVRNLLIFDRIFYTFFYNQFTLALLGTEIYFVRFA